MLSVGYFPSSTLFGRNKQKAPYLPASAMAFISEGSLGLRCSFRLETEEDFPRLKKERQLPTGDFFILLGGLFLEQESRRGSAFKTHCQSLRFTNQT